MVTAIFTYIVIGNLIQISSPKPRSKVQGIHKRVVGGVCLI
jgi:hypothetical protein